MNLFERYCNFNIVDASAIRKGGLAILAYYLLSYLLVGLIVYIDALAAISNSKQLPNYHFAGQTNPLLIILMWPRYEFWYTSRLTSSTIYVQESYAPYLGQYLIWSTALLVILIAGLLVRHYWKPKGDSQLSLP